MRLRSGCQTGQNTLTKRKSEEFSTSGSRVTKRRRSDTPTTDEDRTIEKEEDLSDVDEEILSSEEERKESSDSSSLEANEDDAEDGTIDKEEVLSRVDEENLFSEEEREESSDSSSSEADEDDAEDCVQLSDSIWMYPDRRISKHGEIYEGEIRSGILESHPIVLKLVENIPQSITEARILAKLNNHSHVLSQIHTGTFNFRLVDQIYIALDKCHHENLREFVTNSKDRGFAFNLSRAIEIAGQMVDGVKYIHENRIIHKDLKPDNILFSLDQRLIKIADFGLSQEIDSTSAEVFEEGQFGTNGYRPPESFGRGIISQKSDIFSLGVIFQFVLSNGEHAFGDDSDGWNYRVKNGIIDLSGLLVPNIKTTEHLIKSMIEHKINDRPTIWQVSEHPFWTGNEVSCDFDYHCAESATSASLIPPTSEQPSFNIADVDLDQLLEHVKKIKLRDEAAAAKTRQRDRKMLRLVNDVRINESGSMISFFRTNLLYRRNKSRNLTVDNKHETFLPGEVVIGTGDTLTVEIKCLSHPDIKIMSVDGSNGSIQIDKIMQNFWTMIFKPYPRPEKVKATDRFKVLYRVNVFDFEGKRTDTGFSVHLYVKWPPLHST